MASAPARSPTGEPPQSPPQSFHSPLQSPLHESASSDNDSIPPSSSLNKHNSTSSLPLSQRIESIPSPNNSQSSFRETVSSGNHLNSPSSPLNNINNTFKSPLRSPSHGTVSSGNHLNAPSSPLNKSNKSTGNSPLRSPLNRPASLNHLSIPNSPSNNHVQENHKASPSHNKPIASPKLYPLDLKLSKPFNPVRPPSLQSLTVSEPSRSPSALAIVPDRINGSNTRANFDEEAMDSPLRIDSVSLDRSDGPGRVTGSRGVGNTVIADAVWRAEVRRAAVLFRLLAAVLCVVSFSVMAADRTKGWDGDSYHRYEEYRFVLTMNVITFVYSTFQLYTEIHRILTMKHLIRRPLSYYIDFIMDQILAYLMMSASSVAASHNDIWVSRFGNDEFTRKINASVLVSFFAFISVALSSVISTYVLFRWLA